MLGFNETVVGIVCTRSGADVALKDKSHGEETRVEINGNGGFGLRLGHDLLQT